MILQTLKQIAEKYKFVELATDLADLEADPSLRIGFLGEFSSGKSTLINALAQQPELLPVDLQPTTARICEIVAIEGASEPTFYRIGDEGQQTPIDRGTFTDIAYGHLEGKTLCEIPPVKGLPPGFAFVDTPGLGSLNQAHADITRGILPFLVAAVICIDVSKGGLNQNAIDFLNGPGVRHLSHRFIFALTKADTVSSETGKKVLRKVCEDLATVLPLNEEEVGKLVHLVSANKLTDDSGIDAIRSTIATEFDQRKETLLVEQQVMASNRLLPRALELLSQHKSALQESPSDFEKRKASIENDEQELLKERGRQLERLDKLISNIEVDLRSICDDHKSSLTSASSPESLSNATTELAQSISELVESKLTEFEGTLGRNPSRFTDDLSRVLSKINKGVDLSKLLATAYLAGAMGPLEGGGDIAEHLAGGLGQAAGSDSKEEPESKGGTLSQFIKATGQLMKKVNPVEYVGDLLAEEIKARVLEDKLDELSKKTVSLLKPVLNEYFEREVFGPIHSQLSDLSSDLDTIADERRASFEDRSKRITDIEADVKDLRGYQQ